jgi:uncharacterized protein
VQTGQSRAVLLTLVIKATEQCNASCVYCSVGSKNIKHTKMNDEILSLLFDRIGGYIARSADNEVLIIWHGGEPLLLGAEFFEKVYECESRVLKDKAMKVQHTIQTNLTLYREAFANPLRKLRVNGIGTSFEHIENLRGIGEFTDSSLYDKKFFEGLRLLRKTDLFLGIIYVVTSASLGKAVESLVYITNLVHNRKNAGVHLNTIYLEGEARKESARYLQISPKEFGHFLGEAFAHWLRRRHAMPVVQPFSSIYDYLSSGNRSFCCDEAGICSHTHLGIGPDGEIYQCGRSMDAGLLKLGNLRDTEIAGIADHPVKQLIAKRQEVLASSDCADCRFFDVCHGGCPIDSYVNRSDMLCKSTFCETKKIFYEEFVEPLLGISIRRRNIAEGTAS